MSDGLEWLLEIRAKSDGLDELLKKSDMAVVVLPKVASEAKAAGVASEKAGEGHKKHAKHAEGLTEALHNLVHRGMEPFIKQAENIAEFEIIRRGMDAILEAPEKMIEKVAELGEEALKAAAAAERMDLSFKLTLGAEGAENVLGWIDKIASKTEFTDDQLKGWSKELLNAGVKASDLDKFLAAGLDVAAKSPDKLAGMGNAINALTRAQLTGRVEGRALRGLSIGVDELRTLPQFKGLSAKALQAKMEQGSLKKEDLLALIAGPDKQIGDLALKAGLTMEARLKNLQTLPEQFFQRLAESPAYDHLKDTLGGIFDALDPNSPRGERIFDSLDEAFTKIVGVVADIDFDSIASTLANDVVPGMVAFLDMAKEVGEVFGVIGKGVEFISNTIDKIERFTGMTHEPTRAENRAADPVSAALADELKERLRRRRAGLDAPDEGPLAPGVDRLAARRRELEKSTAEAVPYEEKGSLFTDIMGGFSDPVGAAVNAGARIGRAVFDGARGPGGIDAHSPSKKFAELGEMAADGFAQGFDSDETFAMPPARPGQMPAGGGGAGGVQVSLPAINVTVHGGGASAREDGQAAGEGLAEAFRGNLIRILEQSQREAGA